MSQAHWRDILLHLRELGERAAALTLEVYHTPFHTEFKGPNDPVTEADRRANALIVESLQRAYPGVPIVAEESPASEYQDFASAERAFFVDPVDGTGEFVRKTGEFCVMLGYVERGAPVLGVIAAPVLGRRFEGIVGQGAQVFANDGSSRTMKVGGGRLEDGLAVISRSHYSNASDTALDRLGVQAREPYGSAGLKAMRVADGSALVYLHAGYAGSRWDAAAPEAIARAAGASYTDLHGHAYRYDDGELENQRGMLALPSALLPLALERLGQS